MPDINTVDDPNSGGGTVVSSNQPGLRINGKDIAVDGSPVSSHGTGVHSTPNTANGLSNFRINGTPVNVTGNSDTCGDTRAGSNNFRVS